MLRWKFILRSTPKSAAFVGSKAMILTMNSSRPNKLHVRSFSWLSQKATIFCITIQTIDSAQWVQHWPNIEHLLSGSESKCNFIFYSDLDIPRDEFERNILTRAFPESCSLDGLHLFLFTAEWKNVTIFVISPLTLFVHEKFHLRQTMLSSRFLHIKNKRKR